MKVNREFLRRNGENYPEIAPKNRDFIRFFMLQPILQPQSGLSQRVSYLQLAPLLHAEIQNAHWHRHVLAAESSAQSEYQILTTPALKQTFHFVEKPCISDSAQSHLDDHFDTRTNLTENNTIKKVQECMKF